MPRPQFCPLGFDSNLCDLSITQTCSNYSFCKLQVCSWELPYKFDSDGFLVVKSIGHAIEVFGISGDCFQLHNIDNNVISRAWSDAGWAAAVYCDEIPF